LLSSMSARSVGQPQHARRGRMLAFARDCKCLEATVHISTCYVSGRRGWVEKTSSRSTSMPTRRPRLLERERPQSRQHTAERRSSSRKSSSHWG
jgi:hypothetical protein